MKYWSLTYRGGGIIGFVVNGSWLTSVSGTGFRKSIVEEYNTIYVINLRGNALTYGELQKQEGEGVFGSGSRLSVTIIFLIKTPTLTKQPAIIYYYAVEDYLKRQKKFDLLNNYQTVINPNITWTIITPDVYGDWLDQTVLWPDNSLPLRHATLPTVFATDSRHFVTARDSWVVNFDKLALQNNVQTTINFYESERLRLAEDIKNKIKPLPFTSDLTKISWSNDLYKKLQTNLPIKYNGSQICKCQYCPFIKSRIYFDKLLIERSSQQRQLFLTKPFMNRAIIVTIPGSKNPWSVFITNQLFGLGLCFPEHTYQNNQNGTITTLNAINDHVLKEAQSLYNDLTITHTAIFNYLYGLLHHPTYQTQYQNNLQKGYPSLIWVADKATWWTISNIGRQLAELHLNFTTFTPTTTSPVIIKGIAENIYHVTKMKYDETTNSLIFNNYITITNLPTYIHDYQVFGRSPLKWITSCYKVTIDKDTGIKNDPNQLDSVKQNPRYLLDLVLRIINLTTQTLALIDELTKQTLP